MPGISAGYRFRALAASASAREKSVMSSLATLDRRVYELISDSGSAAAAGPPPMVLAVSLSVPPAMEDDLAAWYAAEHIPMLLAAPGWRRVRRYRLTGGTGPAYLSLHEVASVSVFEEPAYRAAVSTPWMSRIVESAIGRERRVFGFHRSFG